MRKYQKILDKLLNPSIIITFQELEYLLGKLGYIEKKTGKTFRSRKAYISKSRKHIIRIHKPHPGNELKKFVKLYLIAELKKQNLI